MALAFCVDHVDQYTLTKNEILTGFYLAIAPAGEYHYKLVDFTLVKHDKPVANAPKDMHFILYILISEILLQSSV